MIGLGSELLEAIDEAEPQLRKVSESEREIPVLTGGRSGKQGSGLSIDSAWNHDRLFVRALAGESLEFPRHDQAGNVRVQAAQDYPQHWKHHYWGGSYAGQAAPS